VGWGGLSWGSKKRGEGAGGGTTLFCYPIGKKNREKGGTPQGNRFSSWRRSKKKKECTSTRETGEVIKQCTSRAGREGAAESPVEGKKGGNTSAVKRPPVTQKKQKLETKKHTAKTAHTHKTTKKKKKKPTKPTKKKKPTQKKKKTTKTKHKTNPQKKKKKEKKKKKKPKTKKKNTPANKKENKRHAKSH